MVMRMQSCYTSLCGSSPGVSYGILPKEMNVGEKEATKQRHRTVQSAWDAWSLLVLGFHLARHSL